MLAESEKRLLIWMAGRLPRWINSDHLTFTGGCRDGGSRRLFLGRRPARWRW